MAPAFFLALALFVTAPEDEAVATAAPAAAPTPGAPAQGEPASDYELVTWCYGALGAHMGLYDVAMPEVERIERQFAASPAEADEDVASYAAQRAEGKKQLALLRNAMEAAEKASIKPIQEVGVASIRQGESIWTGAKFADPKFLAREWMSWALPDRCAATATQLAARSAVLGQAISYNVKPEAPPADETVAEPAPEAAPETPADATPEPEANPAQPAEEPAAEATPDALDAIISGQIPEETDEGP